MKSSNPEGNKAINQKRGPTTGNAGSMTKRDTYVAEKTASSGEKSKLAKMVTDALEMRGRGTAPTVNPALEGVSSNTNTGPKKNSTADGSKLPKKFKK
jgi:hypothetical protein|tara:strand:+ start:685 stop:978 length:294 start_codon:yes stop_codon:yes gene_type:complete